MRFFRRRNPRAPRQTAGRVSTDRRSSGVTFETMNENDDAMRRGLAFEELVRQLFAEVLDRMDEVNSKVTPDNMVVVGGQRFYVQCKGYRQTPFSGSAALPAMAARGATTIIPPLPADYVTDTQRTLIVSRQVFLIVLTWITVIAVPLLKQHLHLSPETKETVDDYYNVVITIAGMITAGLVPGIAKKMRGDSKDR